MLNRSLCIFVLILVMKSRARDLPSYFPKCNIDDKNLNDCIRNAANGLRSHIRNGVKEIKLPAFDPLVISFGMSQDNGNFRFNVTLINCTVFGFDSYNFEEITYNPKTFKLRGSLKFDKLFIVSDYEASAWLFYFPLVGKGTLDAEYYSLNGTFEINGELKKHRGLEYYHPTSTKVGIKVNNGFNAKLGGLFNDNPELVHLTNELLNENSVQIGDAESAAFEKLTEELLMRFIKSLTKRVPYNKIFPRS